MKTQERFATFGKKFCLVCGGDYMILKIISALVTRFTPKGHWKFADHDGYWYNECSICGCKTENHDGSPPDFSFCPYCGKPMEV